MKKIETYFDHSKYFENKALTIQQFEFLKKYFNNLKEIDFEKDIESKEWMLNPNDWNLISVQSASKDIFDALKY